MAQAFLCQGGGTEEEGQCCVYPQSQGESKDSLDPVMVQERGCAVGGAFACTAWVVHLSHILVPMYFVHCVCKWGGCCQEVSWTVYIPGLPKVPMPIFRTHPLTQMETFLHLINGKLYEELDALLLHLGESPPPRSGAHDNGHLLSSHPVHDVRTD